MDREYASATSLLSRLQSRALPPICASRERPAIVQAIESVVPELDPRRYESKAAPKRGARNHFVRAPACLELFASRFERFAILDHSALLRRPCRELRAARPRVEVSVRLRVRDTFDAPFGTHLLVDRVPVKRQRSVRTRAQVLRLRALEIGKEVETRFVRGFHQHEAHAGMAVAIHGRQRRARWIERLRLQRSRERVAKPEPRIVAVRTITTHRRPGSCPFAGKFAGKAC